MLMLLWMWQHAFRQLARRSISYSEFKARLSRGEVSDRTIEQDEITGKAAPGSAQRQVHRREDCLKRALLLSKRPYRGPQARRGIQKAGVSFSGVHS